MHCLWFIASCHHFFRFQMARGKWSYHLELNHLKTMIKRAYLQQIRKGKRKGRRKGKRKWKRKGQETGNERRKVERKGKERRNKTIEEKMERKNREKGTKGRKEGWQNARKGKTGKSAKNTSTSGLCFIVILLSDCFESQSVSLALWKDFKHFRFSSSHNSLRGFH